jgi:hypothetical protein
MASALCLWRHGTGAKQTVSTVQFVALSFDYVSPESSWFVAGTGEVQRLLVLHGFRH